MIDTDEQPEQVTFEGFPVAGNAFSFRSGGAGATLYTEHQLEYNQHVKGTVVGRVKGIQFMEDSAGGLKRVHLIEVLEANLE